MSRILIPSNYLLVNQIFSYTHLSHSKFLLERGAGGEILEGGSKYWQLLIIFFSWCFLEHFIVTLTPKPYTCTSSSTAFSLPNTINRLQKLDSINILENIN